MTKLSIMVLSDRDIKKHLKTGKITVTPMPDFKTALGSCSIDLRLGYTFRVFEHSRHPYFDPQGKDIPYDVTREIKVKEGEPFVMQPGDFVLAVTIESVSLPDNLLARLEGRSSLGRLGIVVHSTASIFEPGYTGKVVMELGNLARMPVALYPGMRVCALTFEQLSTTVDVPYDKKKTAKYNRQSAPEPSKIADERK